MMMMMMMMMILRVLRMRVRGTTSPQWSRGDGVVDPCTGGPYSDNAALIYGRRRRLALALLSNGDAAAHRGCAGRKTGRLKTQVRKTKVPGDGICKYGIRKYEYARVENANTENASTSLQRWKT